MTESTNTATLPSLTRADVGREAGISIATVRRLEQRGVLHPIKTGGKWLFQVSDVEAARVACAAAGRPLAGHVPRAGMVQAPVHVPAQDDGARAAVVFGDLASGRSPIDVVRQRQLPPAVVKDLAAQFEQLDVDAGATPIAELGEQVFDVQVRIAELVARISAMENTMKNMTRAQCRCGGVAIPPVICVRCGASGIPAAAVAAARAA